MEIYQIDNFVNGWFIGDFEPSLFKNPHVEVALKTYLKGEKESSHKQLIATELTVVVEGRIRMGSIYLSDGQIVKVNPNEFCDFEAVENCKLICVKFPSIPADKVLQI